MALLEDEYRALGPEVVGTSDVPAVFAALRDDPALHHTSGDAIVADSQGRDGQGVGGDGGLVRAAAAVRLRGRGDHQRRDRLLLRAARGTAAGAASSS